MRMVRSFSFLGTLIVVAGLVGCGTEPSGVAGWAPSFSFNPLGSASSCDSSYAWYTSADAPGPHGHFVSFSPTFLDDTLGVRSSCGDLGFGGESAFVRIVWDPSGHLGDPSLWVRKYRRIDVGSPDVWDIPFSDTLDDTTVGDVTFGFQLSSSYDAASLHLFLGSVFDTTNPSASFDLSCDEACTQYWRHIEAPELSQPTVAGDSVVLNWINRNAERAYDSTVVWRDTLPIGYVTGSTQSFTDRSLSVGTYTYSVQHLAPPSPHDLTWHVSDYSTAYQVTLGPPPPTALACAGNFAPSVDCTWSITTPTDKTRIYRNGAVKDSVAAGVAAWTDNTVTRGSSYTYQVAHVRNGVVGALGTSVPTVANPLPPSALACAKTGIASARCTWSNGEPSESTQVQRQEAQTWYSAARLPSGVTQYDNTGLHGGVQYNFRARHVRGSDSSGFSGTQAVTIDSPPPPTNFVCRGNFAAWIDCSWINTDASDSTYLYRDGAIRARIVPGQNSYVDPAVSGVTYAYALRHKDLAVLGPPGPTESEPDSAEAPDNLSCGGTGLTTVTCVWMNTELGETTVVQYQGAHGWITRGTVAPTVPASSSGQFIDTGLTTGFTYTYRTLYKRGSVYGRASNLDQARPDSIAEPYRPIGP